MNDTATTYNCDTCGTECVRMDSAPKARHCGHCGQFPGDAFKTINQMRKAHKLALVLVAAGATGRDVHSPVSRRLALRVTGYDDASDVTWAITTALVAGTVAPA